MSPTNSNRKLYTVLAHILSIFFSFLAPLVILLITDDKVVKNHARNSLNFQLTLLIAFVATTILSFVLIGLLGYPIIFIASIVLPIMAAVKASENPDVIWKYPASFQFFKMEDAAVVANVEVKVETVTEPVTEEKK